LAAAREFFAGWRGFGRFWLLIAGLLVLAGVALQMAGPPAPPAPRQVPGAPAQTNDAEKSPVAAAQPQATPPKTAATRSGRDTPGPIADPDPALLEPAPGFAPNQLPRIASDGRLPMQVYAAGFDGSSRRPRVGLVLAGLGLNQAESEAAVRALPLGITLAISPYAQNTGKLLSAARSTEHEYLISIPMEPQGFPLNDPGKQALMTNLSMEQNRARLIWVLSRLQGYVGAIGAEGSQRGERFASLPEEMGLVLGELAKRGLLYVDPRPGSQPPALVWGRSVDVIVDEPPTATDVETKLAQLVQIARAKGSALGFAGTPRPVILQRLAMWAANLQADGLALAPVSALVQPPTGQ
jgi:uncharacterized protein